MTTTTPPTCQRSTCTADGPADHVGQAHLDPHDRERFDGNETSLRAVTYRVRGELTALHYAGREHPELAKVIDVAIHAALQEIDFLSQQVAHVQVDADRKVRTASAQALDCEHHGKTIQGLEEQLDHFDRSREQSEKGRLALLAGITAFDDFVSAADAVVKDGRPLPDTATVVESIRGVLKKVHAAHMRAWSKPTPTARPTRKA